MKMHDTIVFPKHKLSYPHIYIGTIPLLGWGGGGASLHVGNDTAKQYKTPLEELHITIRVVFVFLLNSK